MADNLNNFKELNFKTCNLDLGRQYITVNRTIKPQEDLIFWKLTHQFLQTQAWTWKIPHLHLCTFEKKENSRSTKIIPKHHFVHLRNCKNFMKIKLSALAWIFSLKKSSWWYCSTLLIFNYTVCNNERTKVKRQKIFCQHEISLKLNSVDKNTCIQLLPVYLQTWFISFKLNPICNEVLPLGYLNSSWSETVRVIISRPRVR